MSCVGGILFLVEPVAVPKLRVRIVASEVVGHNFLVGVPEVDIAHIFFVVEQVRVERVVVPEIVLVIFTLPVAQNHIAKEASHPEKHVGPERRPHHVEPRPEGSQYFVAGVR